MKIHLRDIFGAPEGYVSTACGRDVKPEAATDDPQAVTCRSCRRTDYHSVRNGG